MPQPSRSCPPGAQTSADPERTSALLPESSLTLHHDDLILRPITGRAEIDLFTRIPYVLNPELADDLEAGRRSPEWMWVALRGDHLVARAAWWGRAGDDAPHLMDIFDAEDIDTGVKLLETSLAAIAPRGTRPPEYGRFLPADWRDQPETRRGVQDRIAALELVGAKVFVERLRLEWRPGTPVPAPTDRLSFRPMLDDGELVDLMTLVLDGTLDAHSRHDLTRMTAREAAQAHYDEELARYGTPRDWWRIATLPDGTAAGFVIAAHNGYNPIIAYLGVLPAHRGHGYIDEILAEGTRVLAAQGVPRIRAATDLGNVPMAKAFARAGYVTFERALNMTWS